MRILKNRSKNNVWTTLDLNYLHLQMKKKLLIKIVIIIWAILIIHGNWAIIDLSFYRLHINTDLGRRFAGHNYHSRNTIIRIDESRSSSLCDKNVNNINQFIGFK